MNVTNLKNCEKDLVHTGLIQNFGALLVVDVKHMEIMSFSKNIKEFLPEFECALGMHISKLEEDFDDYLRSIEPGQDGHRLFKNSTLHVQRTHECWIIEIEPEHKYRDPIPNFVVRNLNLLHKTLLDLYYISGYERVLYYEFLSDGSGKVQAEMYRGHGERFQGLRYPATDIPQVARKIYLKTPYRYIHDVSSEPVEIYWNEERLANVPSLERSYLREVSPFHLEYLKNMGVASALSIPNVKNGKLLGLFSLHHSTPKYLNFAVRNVLVAKVQSYLKEHQKLDIEKRMFIYDTYQREVNSFVADLKKSEELDEAVCKRILSLMDATTLAFYSRGSWKSMGMIEDVSEFDKIAGYMLDFNVDKGFKQTNDSVSNHPELEHLTEVAAGCTAVWSFDRQSSEEDFILLFLKPEVIQEVTWGSKTSCMEGSLNPINSFGQWKEAMKGRSEEWSSQSRHLVHAIVSKFSEI